MTGFVVVPNGNIIYARPDYSEDPLLPSHRPRRQPRPSPIPVLAAAGDRPPTTQRRQLNSAEQLPRASTRPTTATATASSTARRSTRPRSSSQPTGRSWSSPARHAPARPVTGVVIQKPFVLQAPAGLRPVINDGSASVPFDDPGLHPGLDPQAAERLAVRPEPGQRAAGPGRRQPRPAGQLHLVQRRTDRRRHQQDDPDHRRRPGDWGGIVFRNYSQTVRRTAAPLSPASSRSDGRRSIRLKGHSPTRRPGQPGRCVSGADDAMSLNFVNSRYGGGAVPQTRGFRYDGDHALQQPAVDHQRRRITDTNGAPTGPLRPAISGDLDSFREDDLARGPLVRRDRPRATASTASGSAPMSTADRRADRRHHLPDNPDDAGRHAELHLRRPLPYILTSRAGRSARPRPGHRRPDHVPSPTGSTSSRHDGQVPAGAPMDRGQRLGASLNVGDRTYIDSSTPTTSFGTDRLPASSAELGRRRPGPLHLALRRHRDHRSIDPTPRSGPRSSSRSTADTGGPGVHQPTPGNVPALARWGSVGMPSGAVAVIDEATSATAAARSNTLRAGHGAAHATSSSSCQGRRFGPFSSVRARHSRYVTNNNFYDNLDAPIRSSPTGCWPPIPLRPLVSGQSVLPRQRDAAATTSTAWVVPGPHGRAAHG